jgi:AraC-like DNA-binding protein
MKAVYFKTQPQNIFDVTKIVTIHYFEFDKSFVFKGEKHNLWELVYVDKGRVQIRRDEEELVLTQGKLVFHKPNEFHSIRALDSSPNFFVLSFVCNSPAMASFERYETQLSQRLTPFLTAILTEAERTYVIPKNDPSMKKLTKREGSAIGGEQLIKTYLEQLLIFLLREASERRGFAIFPEKESMENHLVATAKRFIEEQKEEVFRVDELCSALGYSKSYLSKLFREQTHETIASYAVRIKINEAKRLIREGNLNFAQISDRLAFDNPQYFSRVFKRLTNMTPTEFKQSLLFE